MTLLPPPQVSTGLLQVERISAGQVALFREQSGSFSLEICMLWENRRPDADQPTFPGDHVDALLEELGHLVLRLHDLQRRLPLPLVEPAQFLLRSELLGAAKKEDTLSAQSCLHPP